MISSTNLERPKNHDLPVRLPGAVIIIGGMLQETPFFVPQDHLLRAVRQRDRGGRL